MFRRRSAKLDRRADASIVAQALHAGGARQDRAARAQEGRGRGPAHPRAPREEVARHPSPRRSRSAGRPSTARRAFAITPRPGAARAPWSSTGTSSTRRSTRSSTRSSRTSVDRARAVLRREGEKGKGEEIELEDADALWDFIDARGRKGTQHPALQGPGRDEPRAALGDDARPDARVMLQVRLDDAVQTDQIFTILWATRSSRAGSSSRTTRST